MQAEILARTPEQLAISPGVGAFLTVFILGIAMILLVLNMSKHLRRVDRHRIEAEMRAEFKAERAAAKAAAEAEALGDVATEEPMLGEPVADDADAAISDEK